MKITIGSDPELFFIENGEVTPFHFLLDKKEKVTYDGVTILRDNVLVEYNTQPSSSKDEFISTMRRSYNVVRKYVKSLGTNYDVVNIPSHEFVSLPEGFDDFGCNPSINAWTFLEEIPKPLKDRPLLRSAGGHIHIGLPPDVDPVLVIRACDLFLGVPSTFMDTDYTRRLLYGKAGSYRNTPYGVEYRTLSNFWVKDPELIGWVWDNVERAVKYAADMEFMQRLDEDSYQIILAIGGDMDAAKFIMSKYQQQIK